VSIRQKAAIDWRVKVHTEAGKMFAALTLCDVPILPGRPHTK
jgi:hypothetical protein